METYRVYLGIDDFNDLAKMYPPKNGKITIEMRGLDNLISEKDFAVEYILDKALQRGQAYSPHGKVIYIPVVENPNDIGKPTKKYLPTLFPGV